MRKYLSGHMYRGASHETSDTCGNCDGAGCMDDQRCEMVFQYDTPDERRLHTEVIELRKKLKELELAKASSAFAVDRIARFRVMAVNADTDPSVRAVLKDLLRIGD